MRSLRFLPLLSLVLLTGCYHARVETGRAPSTAVVERTFASGWLFGLVPPSTVQVAEQCPNGVAVVETQLSFVNQLVSALTFGIYTPMHIRVTCAAEAGAALHPPADAVTLRAGAPADEVVAAFSAAADRAVESGQPVYVRFEGAQP